MDSALDEFVQEWLRLDKNDVTRKEVIDLREAGDILELSHRMRRVNPRIEFGTAGLRGKMEAGWARMNDLTVLQASQGLCDYVLKNVVDAQARGVVIGHDHRYHSKEWSELTAMVFLNNGFKVYLHSNLVHTPLVPFSVSRLKASCGVMITASHNPKCDNGYKVYWENAVQIISPHDKGIAQSILQNLEPRSWDTEIVHNSQYCLDKTQEISDLYFECLMENSLLQERLPLNVKFVNTSMHGVSHKFVERAFATLGLPSFIAVESQRDPDPEFPTVRFPNPEEKGALDLAIQVGNEVQTNYVLAQDPDADRFCAAERSHDGKWTVFTGDQLGAIFAARCQETYRNSGKPLNRLAMVASTVSSKMVEAMAMKEGFKFVECLTGFKYIGNTALQLVEQGYDVPFGYEEAIGFMIGQDIRDKDGVSASVCFAELAIDLERKGSSVANYLQQQYEKYGYFKTANSYFICRVPATTDKIFQRLRHFNGNAELNFPESIAGLKITNVKDLTVGYDSTNPPTFKPTLPLSSGHMVQFRAESSDGSSKISLTIRTSGTEPKIKYYLEGSGQDVSKVAETLTKVAIQLRDVWMEAEKNGLGFP